MSNHTGRRMPVKTVALEFTQDGYPDFHAKGRTNVPLRIADAFKSGDEEQGRAAILLIFPEWDFVDEEGEPIPHTAQGIGMMPQDLLQAMMVRWGEAVAGAAAIPKASVDGSSPTSPDAPGETEEAGSLSSTPASVSPESSDDGPGNS